uniref:Uncharacterized protein n=1 Tax=Arundo donax TaxID=35708 RepID=A0A0A9BVD7_ARUDO
MFNKFRVLRARNLVVRHYQE